MTDRCPPFPHLCLPPHPLPSGHHHTIVCVYGSCIYVLWLIPSPSFIQSSPPPSPLTAVSLFYINMGSQNLSVPQNHLQGLLKQRLPDTTPRVPESVGLGWGPRIGISYEFTGPGLHFEKCLLEEPDRTHVFRWCSQLRHTTLQKLTM